MADGDLLSLLLKVEGGEASATEVSKLEDAIKRVDAQAAQSDDALKDRFQHNFQHLALRGFIADSARSIGLGGELRPVISLLNMGLTELEGTLGATAAAFTPYLAALAAIAALGYVVYEHFNKQNENLDASYAKYKENTTALDEYVAAGGRLSAVMKAAADQTKEEAAENIKLIAAKTALKVSRLEEAIARRTDMDSNEAANASMGATTIMAGNNANALKDLNKQLIAGRELLEAQEHGNLTVNEYRKEGTKILQDKTKAEENDARITKSLVDEALKLYAAEDAAGEKALLGQIGHLKTIEQEEIRQSERIKELNETTLSDTVTSWDTKDKAINKFQNHELRQIEETYRKEKEAALLAGADTISAERLRGEAILALDKNVSAQRIQNYTEVQQAGINAVEAFETGFAQAAARSIVESKNMSEAMTALAKQVAEQIIADLIRIAIQSVITKEAVAAVFVL